MLPQFAVTVKAAPANSWLQAGAYSGGAGSMPAAPDSEHKSRPIGGKGYALKRGLVTYLDIDEKQYHSIDLPNQTD